MEMLAILYSLLLLVHATVTAPPRTLSSNITNALLQALPLFQRAFTHHLVVLPHDSHVTITKKMAAGAELSGRKSPLCLREDLSGTYGDFFLESTVMAE